MIEFAKRSVNRSIARMSQLSGPRVEWLHSGQLGLAAMIRSIESAQQAIALEMYIFQECEIGNRFRDALADAAKRGVRVRILVDAVGSFELPSAYFQPAIDAGAECRWFNPLELRRLSYRNHRKMLIVDESVAYIGGFNIGTDYDGDGVTCGWMDLGMVIRGELVAELLKAFHAIFGAASFKHRRLARFRRQIASQRIATSEGELFLLAPGVGRNPAREALIADIGRAKQVRMTTAYFLPGRALRLAFCRAARRGAKVQLLLPGMSDVRLAQWAARGQYGRLLRAGVEIYEYQPAMLHAKRYLLDDAVYVGSANLDLRSLNINYEILVRIVDPAVAAEGHAKFEEDLERSRQIRPSEWKRRGWWHKLLERMSAAVLVSLDLGYATRQLAMLGEVGHGKSPRRSSD